MEWQAGGPWDIVDAMVNTAGSIVQVIAGLILGFFIGLELIQMLVDRNNFQDFDLLPALAKWMFKSWVGILLVSNAFVIVGAIFTIGQDLVMGASADALEALYFDTDYFREHLQEYATIGELVGLWFQLGVLGFVFRAVEIVVWLVVVGRFLEIFMYIAAAPIPLATMANQEYRTMGNNYLKSIGALAFQGFLMFAVIAVVGSLIVGVATNFGTDNAGSGFWGVLGYMVLLVFCLFKTSAVSKSIFGAH